MSLKALNSGRRRHEIKRCRPAGYVIDEAKCVPLVAEIGIFGACSNGANMADDKARKIAEEALNRLSAELEAGRSQALKNYLAAMGRFHRYSWNNVILIH